MNHSTVKNEIISQLEGAKNIGQKLIDAGDDPNDCIKTIVMKGLALAKIYPQYRQLIINETKRAAIVLYRHRKLWVA